MKPSVKSLTLLVTSTVVVALAASHLQSVVAATTTNVARMTEDEEDSTITQLAVRMLEQSQISHRKLDRDLAAQMLTSYTDSLDGNHTIFLQSDLDEFAKLAPTLPASIEDEGDVSAEKLIFGRYLQRLQERNTYVAHVLDTEKFDFAGHETVTANRDKAPNPKDIDDAHNLWRQHVQVEDLQERLNGTKAETIPTVVKNRYTRQLETARKLSKQGRLEIFLDALAHVYDPHSDYFDHEDLESFNISMNLSLYGVGATLESKDGYPTVVQLVPGGPAARSGLLQAGDRIVTVEKADGHTTVDLVNLPLPQAVEYIRGRKGTSVKLTILPAGAPENSTAKAVTLQRDEIKLEDQQAKASIIDLPVQGGGTRRLGVIDLPSFYGNNDGPRAQSATADVSALLKKLKKEKVAGIVLDLRRNGGGSLSEAIDLTGLFAPAGAVVQTRDLSGKVNVQKDHGKPVYTGPLIVLTSRMSASASEIVAGALQDYGRAMVVGDASTFGKGTVQTLVPLASLFKREGIKLPEDPGGLKVTISKFYRPSGKSTQLKGVEADIVLPSYTDIPEIGESQLKHPLAWDTISPAHFPHLDLVTPYVSALREHSIQRMSTDSGFTYLHQDLERLAKLRTEATVSLNEEERRKTIQQDEAEAKAHHEQTLAHESAPTPVYEITVEHATDPGLPTPKSPKKPKSLGMAQAGKTSRAPAAADADKEPDLQLHEAENILSDYVEMLSAHGNQVAGSE